MKKPDNIILFVFLILLPNTHVFTSGIFGGQIAVLYILIFLTFALGAVSIYRIISEKTAGSGDRSGHDPAGRIVKNAINISRADILVAVYFAYVLISIFLIRKMGIDAPMIFQWLAVAVGYILIRGVTNRKIILEGLVATGFVQAAIAYMQFFNLLTSNNLFFDVTGGFGNPGQLGGFLSVTFVIAIGLIINEKRRTHRWLRVLVAILIGVALIISDSRAGWVAAAVGTAFIFLRAARSVKKSRIIFGLGVLAIISVLLYNYKKDSADGRICIWRVSADMIAEKPVLGHGAGSFPQKYMYAQARYFESNPDSSFVNVADNVIYPFNEFIRLWVELGIVGLLIATALFTVVLFRKPTDRTQVVLKGAFCALIVVSCFSYPASVFPLLFLYPVILGSLESTTVFRIKRSTLIYVATAICSLAIISLTVRHLVFMQEANRAGGGLKNKSKEYLKNNYYRLYNNADFLNFYTQHIANEDNAAVSIEILESASRLIPSSELLCDLGKLYQRSGRFSDAEACFTTAHHMIPSRIYPLYCLFLLHLELGDGLDYEFARKIDAHKVKLHNSISLRIKGEIKAYLASENEIEPDRGD